MCVHLENCLHCRSSAHLRVPGSQPPVKKNAMRFHFFLLLAAPLLSFAQAPPAAPPPQVDQALRARAAAFLQYQIDGNFRKAYDLVAEDSKDDYFSAAKQKAISFVIDDIQYADDFSKATVKAT